jgi:hypothetical protein
MKRQPETSMTGFMIALIAAAGLTAVFAPAPAHAQPASLCRDPSSVPGFLLDDLRIRRTFLNFTLAQCEQALPFAIEQCLSAVKSEGDCSEDFARSRAQTEQSLCGTLSTKQEQKDCSALSKSELQAALELIRDQVAAGSEECESPAFEDEFINTVPPGAGRACPPPPPV